MIKTFAVTLAACLLLGAAPAATNTASAGEPGAGETGLAEGAAGEGTSGSVGRRTAPTESAGFYLHARIPENQTDPNKSYFDLRVAPGDAQALYVDVVNETGAPMQVQVRAVSASTNRNGVIDYVTPNVRDETLLHPFSALATVKTETLRVPANGTATARVDIRLPAQSFDGVVLGGLLFSRVKEEAAGESSSAAHGARIENRFSYVVGAVLRETDAAAPPDFELVQIKPELVENRASAVHYIRNRNAAIVKNMSLSMRITRADESAPVADIEKTGLDMAPNSVLPFAPLLVEETLRPGRYHSVVELAHGGKTWRFERDFTVAREEAGDINALVVRPQAPAALPLWTVILLVMLAAAVLALLGYLLWQRRAAARANKGRGEDR